MTAETKTTAAPRPFVPVEKSAALRFVEAAEKIVSTQRVAAEASRNVEDARNALEAADHELRSAGIDVADSDSFAQGYRAHEQEELAQFNGARALPTLSHTDWLDLLSVWKAAFALDAASAANAKLAELLGAQPVGVLSELTVKQLRSWMATVNHVAEFHAFKHLPNQTQEAALRMLDDMRATLQSLPAESGT